MKEQLDSLINQMVGIFNNNRHAFGVLVINGENYQVGPNLFNLNQVEEINIIEVDTTKNLARAAIKLK